MAGLVEESIAAFRRATNLDGQNPEVWSNVARALSMAGMEEEACKARDTEAKLLSSRGRQRREGRSGKRGNSHSRGAKNP